MNHSSPAESVSINLLHEEILLIIFSWLTPKENGQARAICKVWKKIADDNLLWKGYCRSDLSIKLEGKQNWKAIYCEEIPYAAYLSTLDAYQRIHFELVETKDLSLEKTYTAAFQKFDNFQKIARFHEKSETLIEKILGPSLMNRVTEIEGISSTYTELKERLHSLSTPDLIKGKRSGGKRFYAFPLLHNGTLKTLGLVVEEVNFEKMWSLQIFNESLAKTYRLFQLSFPYCQAVFKPDTGLLYLRRLCLGQELKISEIETYAIPNLAKRTT